MVCGLIDRVKKVFLTTGVNKVISLYTNVQDALANDPLFQAR